MMEVIEGVRNAVSIYFNIDIDADVYRKEIRDLMSIDNKSPDEIVKVIKWARNDDFWKSNFMSITKLRKRNKEKVKYYDVFNEKRKSNGSNKTNTRGFSEITDNAW